MELIRIGAIAPPGESRAAWARECLARAIEADVFPVDISSDQITTFSVTLNPGLADKLTALAKKHERPVIELAAGLIAAVGTAAPVAHEAAVVGQHDIAGISRVRPILHPLLRTSVQGMRDGKIVFAEAATGTGKGRAIASMASNAASDGDTVVVSAPLAVAWQLLDDLAEVEEARQAGVCLILGRPNFVSPELLQEWAEDQGNSAVLEWIAAGGPPLSERAVKAGKIIGQSLNWLLEDALSLAEDLPVSSVVLSAGVDESECGGESVYQALRGRKSEAGIIICSHHLLAAHIRQVQLRGLTPEDMGTANTSIPLMIDTLIVDEAHLLESAFAAIYSHAIHLRSLLRTVERNIKRNKKPLIDAINGLYRHVLTLERGGYKRELTGRLDEIDGLAPVMENLKSALDGINHKPLDEKSKIQLYLMQRAVKEALSGRASIRFEFSPVRDYPRITVGRANLDKPLRLLWDNTAGAALVSATIYNGNDEATLLRWKLAVPKDRALYLPSIQPKWIIQAVTLHPNKVDWRPDDSPEWVGQASKTVTAITAKAKGGTLVLCTSYSNAEQLGRALSALGPRLIVQSGSLRANSCAAQYRALYKAGIKPVWIGLGAAWTGIDLSDNDVPPEKDQLLTDLIITRLPVGLNNTLTHQRRVDIGGKGIVWQEAVWHFRQGLGRLVRREGVKERNLYVLDSRLEGKDTWVTGFNRVLSRYRNR